MLKVRSRSYNRTGWEKKTPGCSIKEHTDLRKEWECPLDCWEHLIYSDVDGQHIRLIILNVNSGLKNHGCARKVLARAAIMHGRFTPLRHASSSCMQALLVFIEDGKTRYASFHSLMNEMGLSIIIGLIRDLEPSLPIAS